MPGSVLALGMVCTLKGLQSTFMFHTRDRQVFCSLPEYLPCFGIPKVHPISDHVWLRKTEALRATRPRRVGVSTLPLSSTLVYFVASLLNFSVPWKQLCICRREFKRHSKEEADPETFIYIMLCKISDTWTGRQLSGGELAFKVLLQTPALGERELKDSN